MADGKDHIGQVPSDQQVLLSVKYKSPGDAFEMQSPLSGPASPTPSPAEKSAYLAQLRSETTKMQDDINRELTRRMEADKAAAAAASASAAPGSISSNAKNAAAVDDAKEEENYGEEVGEDD